MHPGQKSGPESPPIPNATTTPPLEELVALLEEPLRLDDLAGALERLTQRLGLPTFHPVVLESFQKVRWVRHVREAEGALPGPRYLEWLAWFHATLQPETYLEIGVQSGQSLQHARPPTRAVGVDPEPRISHPLGAETQVFPLTSDAFFAQHDLFAVLGRENLSLAFIDGLHTFDQALRDFINVERYANPATVVLFHDTYPIVPVTAQRERQSIFWTGDVWKVLPILTTHRPDLKIFTIPTYPSGLTVVQGLDPASRVLEERFAELVGEMLPREPGEWLPRLRQLVNPVPNDFGTVAQRLAAEGRGGEGAG